MNSTEISNLIAHYQTSGPSILKTDAYLASSLLQKAIRRSEIELAVYSVTALWHLRGRNVWRRIAIIAFEDVGIGSSKAIIDAMQEAQVRHMSDGTGLQELVRVVVQMANAPKDRSADYLFSAAFHSQSYERTRANACSLRLEDQLSWIGNSDSDLVEQAIAVWFAASVDAPGERRFATAKSEDVLRHFSKLGVPLRLLAASRTALRLTREPFVLLLPLLWLAARERDPSSVQSIKCPPTSVIAGIPSYTFDKHTRAGRVALRHLATQNETVRETAGKFVAEYRAIEAVAMSAFYVDAAPVSKRLLWSQSEGLEKLGRRADFESVGFPEEGISPMLQVVEKELAALDRYRSETLEKSLRQGRR